MTLKRKCPALLMGLTVFWIFSLGAISERTTGEENSKPDAKPSCQVCLDILEKVRPLKKKAEGLEISDLSYESTRNQDTVVLEAMSYIKKLLDNEALKKPQGIETLIQVWSSVAHLDAGDHAIAYNYYEQLKPFESQIAESLKKKMKETREEKTKSQLEQVEISLGIVSAQASGVGNG